MSEVRFAEARDGSWRIVPKYDHQWRPWKGQYEKLYYDIKLKGSARIKFKCWPNAGTFHYMKNGRVYEGEKVQYIRISREQEL